MRKQIGIAAMREEGYRLPIENEKKLQKTEFAWWASPVFIIFLTISMSVLDGMVLYDILDRAATQSEKMGYIVSFGIALVLNLIPLLVAKFIHQAIYKLKRGAAVLAILATVAFFILFASTVWLRFAYQDIYGDAAGSSLINEKQVEESMGEDVQADPKGLATVLLFSIEPLVTSLVNFGLVYISDDELRARLNHLRTRRLELKEEESHLRAYMAATEPADVRRNQLLLLDGERKSAAQDEIHARCCVLKAMARGYLAEYLQDPEGVSYVTSSMDEKNNVSQERTDLEKTERTKEIRMEKKAA